MSPLRFIRNGDYDYSNGVISGHNTGGFYFMSSPSSTIYATVLYFAAARLGPQSADSKGYGFTVRCLVR